MKKLLILIVLLSLFATGCSVSATTAEGRKNKIEAFLVAADVKPNSQEMPVIYDLTIAEKSEIVNQISFKLVEGRELVMIDFLDYQWATWREDVGFITSYLANFEAIRQKPQQSKPERTINLKTSTQFVKTQQIYKRVSLALERQLESINELYYLVRESLIITWQVDQSNLSLERVAFTFYDVDSEKYIDVSYSDQILIVVESNNQSARHGTDLLEYYLNDDMIEEFVTLIPIDVKLPVKLSYQLLPFQIAEDEFYAIATRSDLGYTPSDQLDIDQQLGFVKLESPIDDGVNVIFYQLTNEKGSEIETTETE